MIRYACVAADRLSGEAYVTEPTNYTKLSEKITCRSG
jgi:hypothetical protein